MGTTRFILSVLLAASLALAATACIAQPTTPAKAAKPLRLLVLGGTNFLGPAVVDSAKARGHSVTIFNRGKTEKRIGAVDGVEHLYGNRDPKLRADDKDAASPQGLTQLEKGEWDAVIDTSGYVPRIVKASAELLAPRVKQYIFISTVSVYAQNSTGEQDENSELATIPDPTNEEVGKYYGALKALCEQAAEAAMPGRTCSIRPGFIVGPGDSSDRFTSWPVRASKGGEMLAPGAPMDHVQVIDVRDLADFVIHSAENNLKGSYNAVGNPLRWGMVLQTCLDASKDKAPTPTKLTWVPPDFIEEHKVAPGGPELPIWVPSSGADAGFHTRSNARGVAAGLKFRPVRDTIDALLVWWPKEVARRDRVAKQLIAEAEAKGTEVPRFGDPNRPRSGLAPEKEAALLIAWHERESAPKPTPASSGK